MKRNSISACIVLWAALISCGWGEAPCPAVVRSEVEISGADFSLADLLGPAACPALRKAAAQVRLGRAPLAGSTRVFAGEELRAQIERMQQGDAPLRRSSVEVPERVVVRLAGKRVSCAEIWARLFGERDFTPVGCGIGERVASGGDFEIVRRSWDPLREDWNMVVRCKRPGDCAPFLVRVPETAALELGLERLKQAGRAGRTDSKGTNLREIVVRPGQSATLLWEEHGIRLRIPVICLDGGAKGAMVRARLRSGGRTLQAVVVDAGTVRAIV